MEQRFGGNDGHLYTSDSKPHCRIRWGNLTAPCFRPWCSLRFFWRPLRCLQKLTETAEEVTALCVNHLHLIQLGIPLILARRKLQSVSCMYPRTAMSVAQDICRWYWHFAVSERLGNSAGCYPDTMVQVWLLRTECFDLWHFLAWHFVQWTLTSRFLLFFCFLKMYSNKAIQVLSFTNKRSSFAAHPPSLREHYPLSEAFCGRQHLTHSDKQSLS